MKTLFPKSILLAAVWHLLIPGTAPAQDKAEASADSNPEAIPEVKEERKANPSNAAKAIDAYFDRRFEAKPGETGQLLKKLAGAGFEKMDELERLLRAPRAIYPGLAPLVGKYSRHEVICDHVDYKSNFLMYVPKDLKLDAPASLVIVGHGGNSSMDPKRAQSTAQSYLGMYAPGICSKLGAIVVAPSSGRGWGHIGNSLILSTISKVQRMFSIDPDRIYITGQSMGGHLSYRSALSLPDRWGAVSPHSGGYDFVEKGSIGNLLSVPGYAIWGVREPYGINKDNRTNAKWGKAHDLDWIFVEKNGGHTIYRDELPKVAAFFQENPRDLYRDTVYLHQGGAMKFINTWQVKGWPEHKVYSDTRPLRWNLRHWVEIEPRPDLKEPLTVLARNKGDNQFEITSNQVRKLTLFLHPKMIDFSRPVSVKVNGENVHTGKAIADPGLMFELAREFDDRGRVFRSRIELLISTDRKVEIPSKEPAE